MLLLLVLACAGNTLAGEPSPETFLPSADGKDAYTPAAAFGKDVFVVAWRSGNLAPGDLREGVKFEAAIVGCRVDKSSKALDVKPFVISAAADLRERPMMAFGGDVFLVVWQDLRGGKDWDVYAARVSPDGKALDPDGIAVGAGEHNQALPAVAWDGANFQVVWMDFRSGTQYQIYGARVSKDGKVLDPNGTLLVSSQARSGNGLDQLFNPSVASLPGSGRSLVFWMASHLNMNKPLAACQFVQDGKPVGAQTFAATNARGPGPGGQHSTFPAALAAGDKGFLVTWTTNAPYSRGSPPNDANAKLLDAEGKEGKSLAMAGILPKPWSCPQRIRNPRAAWDGKAYVAAWDEWDREPLGIKAGSKRPVEAVFTARVSAEGEPGEKTRLSGEFDSPAIKPCVASDGAGTSLVAYEKHPDKAETPVKIGIRIVAAK